MVNETSFSVYKVAIGGKKLKRDFVVDSNKRVVRAISLRDSDLHTEHRIDDIQSVQDSDSNIPEEFVLVISDDLEYPLTDVVHAICLLFFFETTVIYP